MDKNWHQQHPMAPNAPPAERAKWHLEHQRHCGCRPMPLSIKAWLAQHHERPRTLQPHPTDNKGNHTQ